MTGVLRRIALPVLLMALFVVNRGLAAASSAAASPALFGFGAVLYPQGSNVQEALTMADDLDLDWIAVPVAWAELQPSSDANPDLTALDAVMQFAGQHHIAVMLSISKAPDWARIPLGPDPALTAEFVAALSQRYPAALQAVELFPWANTRAGWGTAANPLAYAALVQITTSRLQQIQSPVVLVSAGLMPLAAQPADGDMDDLVFLSTLYEAGAGSRMPIVSIRFPDLAADPLTFPDGTEHRVLRHYEEVRQIMAENNYKKGQIWITHLPLPSGKINVSDSAIKDVNAQSTWMSQVYLQTRGQLYIGVTFGQSLNQGSEGLAAEVPSLQQGQGEYHPFYAVLRQMISLNKMGSVIDKPGRSKAGNFLKNRP